MGGVGAGGAPPKDGLTMYRGYIGADAPHVRDTRARRTDAGLCTMCGRGRPDGGTWYAAHALTGDAGDGGLASGRLAVLGHLV